MNPINILIIDDELEESSSEIDILRDDGFKIILINKAKDCKQKFIELRGKINVVILDIMMPPQGYADLKETKGGVHTGFKILHDLRAVLGLVPILIITAHSLKEIEPYLDEITHVMLKPKSPSEISREIKKMLEIDTEGI